MNYENFFFLGVEFWCFLVQFKGFLLLLLLLVVLRLICIVVVEFFVLLSLGWIDEVEWKSTKRLVSLLDFSSTFWKLFLLVLMSILEWIEALIIKYFSLGLWCYDQQKDFSMYIVDSICIQKTIYQLSHHNFDSEWFQVQNIEEYLLWSDIVLNFLYWLRNHQVKFYYP